MTVLDGTRRRGLAWLGRIQPKYWASLLITLILVVGEARYSILGGYERLVAALATCVVAEWALAHALGDRPASLQSAYISGISLSLLIKPQASILWPFVLGGLLSIGSKYVLRVRGRHLWNPSNFGISVLLLVAPAQVSILSHQWGNDLRTNAVIWSVGILVAARARVLHVTVAYVASFVLAAWGRAALVGGPLWAELAPLTGPMYQLFILFMITDPRTTVATRRGRVVVAVVIAAIETLIRLAGDAHVAAFDRLYVAPPILALFLVGPVAMWIDLRRTRPSLTDIAEKQPCSSPQT